MSTPSKSKGCVHEQCWWSGRLAHTASQHQSLLAGRLWGSAPQKVQQQLHQMLSQLHVHICRQQMEVASCMAGTYKRERREYKASSEAAPVVSDCTGTPSIPRKFSWKGSQSCLGAAICQADQVTACHAAEDGHSQPPNSYIMPYSDMKPPSQRTPRFARQPPVLAQASK